jgi:hypothetical protein
MAICGSTCSLSAGGVLVVEGHKFTIDLGSNEIDIRAFGSGQYGDFVACAKTGTLAFDSYIRPDLDVGSIVTIGASIGTESFTIPVVITSQNINVDAKDVVQFTTNSRIFSAIQIV